MLRSILAVCFLFVSATFAQAQSYRLVCFEEGGFKAVADRVVNQMQWHNNSLGQTAGRNFITRQGCDYSNKQLSEPLFADIYQTAEGFIFPIYRVRMGPTRQLMYVADGIFLAEHWRITSICGRGSVGECIAPRNCEVLRGFVQVSGGYTPRYMRIPRGCGL